MNRLEFLLNRLEDARAVAADTARRSAKQPDDFWLAVAARNQRMEVRRVEEELRQIGYDPESYAS